MMNHHNLGQEANSLTNGVSLGPETRNGAQDDLHTEYNGRLSYQESKTLKSVHQEKQYAITDASSDIAARVRPTNGLVRHAFFLSAFNETSAKQMAGSLAEYLDQQDQDDIDMCHVKMSDLAHTLSSRRTHMKARVGVTASTIAELRIALTDSAITFARAKKSPRIAFVFTGQGAQWSEMGDSLITDYPVFRQRIEMAEQFFSNLGSSWTLRGT